MTPTRTPALGTALLVIGVSLAACTTEQQSTPAPTLSSTTSTSTTLLPETTSTTGAPPETSEAATTEAPTTTELPPGPADAVVPLLTGGAEGGWLFLGTWQSDRWEDSFTDDGEPIDPTLAAGTPVIVTNLDGETDGALGSAVESCFDGRVGPTVDVAVAAPDPPGFGYGTLALVQVDWPLKPRPVAVTASAPASYQALGESVFAELPVDASLGSVAQLVVTDLDGDGDDEALVSFEFIQPTAGPGAPGDLSTLFVVDTATVTPATILESHVPTELPESAFPIIERSRVIDVADLNGDGRTEVVVHSWYYEGASVGVYTYDGTTLEQVLRTGCGS